MAKEIKFRDDLDKRTRELLHKIESREALLRQLDKKMSDKLLDASGSMTSPDLTSLNEQRKAAWDDLRNARSELLEVTAEKQKILSDAGLDWREVPIRLDELPSTSQEFAVRLHGMRQPMRDTLMSKMLSTGLLKPYVYVAPPLWGDR
jgi:hypothetical protein